MSFWKGGGGGLKQAAGFFSPQEKGEMKSALHNLWWFDCAPPLLFPVFRILVQATVEESCWGGGGEGAAEEGWSKAVFESRWCLFSSSCENEIYINVFQ